jgi:DHA1 family bicyclomycin/chloramphenicol resistance-like MFS transporter
MKQPFAKSMVLVTVILMDLLVGTEVDLFVPSFPELQSQFNLSPFWVEALLSVNFVGFCLSLFFVGSLADRYGRKPIIVLGLITFIIGSLLCLEAATYYLLLTGRFLQGVGVAAPTILSFLIIADSYSLKKQQYLMAMLNGVMNASAGAAPVVGSYITLYFHWQGNFVTLLLLGLTTLAMTLLFIPTYKLPEHKETPLLRGYIPILQSKPLMLLIVNMVFTFVPYWIFVGMSPILYMEDLGVSLSHFGYYQGTLALVFAFGSIISGLIISRYKQRKMLSVSSQICIAGLIDLLRK